MLPILAAQDVTHVMLTHLHPDHIAGSITADGAAAFANAMLLVSEEEHNFWTRDEPFGDENMDQWQQLAKAVISAYGERVETFSVNADLGHDMTAVALPGHTPGHSGFRIDDGNESLIMVCDIFHAPDLQLADPEIAIAFDIDADTARQTRKRTLDMIAIEGLTFTGGQGAKIAYPIKKRDGRYISEIEAPEGLRYVVITTHAKGMVPRYCGQKHIYETDASGNSRAHQ